MHDSTASGIFFSFKIVFFFLGGGGGEPRCNCIRMQVVESDKLKNSLGGSDDTQGPKCHSPRTKCFVGDMD